MDTLNELNRAETNVISHSDDLSTYLSAGDAKHVPDEMDGIRSHVDTSSGCLDMPNIGPDMNSTANMPENVRTPLKENKTAGMSQSVDLGQNNNPNTTPTKDYENVRVVVYLRGVQRGCAEEGERGSTPTG